MVPGVSEILACDRPQRRWWTRGWHAPAWRSSPLHGPNRRRFGSGRMSDRGRTIRSRWWTVLGHSAPKSSGAKDCREARFRTGTRTVSHVSRRISSRAARNAIRNHRARNGLTHSSPPPRLCARPLLGTARTSLGERLELQCGLLGPDFSNRITCHRTA